MKISVHFRRIVRDSIRMYFAPLVGAYKGMREEMRKVDKDIERRRREESQQQHNDVVHHA